MLEVLFLGLLLTVILLGWGCTWLCIRWSNSFMPVAVPNERSAHQTPTPTGGGAAFVVVTLIGVGVYVLFGTDTVAWSTASLELVLLLPALCVGLIGWLDDFMELSASVRFSGQCLVAIAAGIVLGGFPPVMVGGLEIDTGLAGVIISAVFFIYFTNIYNFMDGIDGLAASEGLFILAVSGLLIWWQGDLPVAVSIAAAAVAGFLLLNLPPARIFMGDVGAYFMGGLIAVATVHYSILGVTTIWFWFILAGVFLADASITLLTRFCLGENIFRAHNIHAYQHAGRQFGVINTLSAVTLINVVWLAPLALWAQLNPGTGLLVTVIAYTPLILLVIYLKAGRRKTGAASA